MDSHVEMLIGAFLIIIYALERFNSPPNIRASTTAGRYYSASFVYLMFYLISFYLLTKYPWLLTKLNLMKEVHATGEAGAKDSTPIIIGMVLSLLVPKIPLISSLDARLKNFLHRLAAIPYEAIRLSKELQDCSYVVPGRLNPEDEHVKKVMKELLDQGFENPDKLLASQDRVIQNWTKIISLMIQLRAWQSSTQFTAFVQERSGQFSRISEQYERLSRMVNNAFSLTEQVGKHEKLDTSLREAIKKVTDKFDKDMIGEQQAMFSEMCDFISHGLLKTCFRGAVRCKCVADMGFVGMEDKKSAGLPVNCAVSLFGLLLVLVLVNFILFNPAPGEANKVLLMVTMIVSIYSAAVICAVIPKQLWPYFRATDTNHYPALGYVLSGGMAIVASIVISLSFKTLVFAIEPEVTGFAAPFAMAWQNFTTSSYPWLTMSFVCALSIAFLIDWRQPDWIKPAWSRYANGIFQAIVLLCSATLVHWWLSGLSTAGEFFGRVPELSHIIRLASIIGFVLGYFVPTWYKRSVLESTDKSDAMQNAVVDDQPLKGAV